MHMLFFFEKFINEAFQRRMLPYIYKILNPVNASFIMPVAFSFDIFCVMQLLYKVLTAISASSLFAYFCLSMFVAINDCGRER